VTVQTLKFFLRLFVTVNTRARYSHRVGTNLWITVVRQGAHAVRARKIASAIR
jgi:hypothetical protein